MEMRRFEKWAVNSFSDPYLRWYLLPRFLALLDGPLEGHGLGLGPGVGWETLVLAEQFPRATLTGVDYDPDQVAQARRNLASRPSLTQRVSFHRGDATAGEFLAATFDFAYALNVLHHVADYPAVIREVHRMLRPDGRFLRPESLSILLPAGSPPAVPAREPLHPSRAGPGARGRRVRGGGGDRVGRHLPESPAPVSPAPVSALPIVNALPKRTSAILLVSPACGTGGQAGRMGLRLAVSAPASRGTGR